MVQKQAELDLPHNILFDPHLRYLFFAENLQRTNESQILLDNFVDFAISALPCLLQKYKITDPVYFLTIKLCRK